jgi:hypothetical protein
VGVVEVRDGIRWRHRCPIEHVLEKLR